MGDELTRQQVKRDDFLRMLAINPDQALLHWKRLKPGEPLVVVTYMTLAYGPDFAQHFKKEADKHKRPDLLITVTNLPYVTPESLTKQGYRFQRRVGNSDLEIWVHPTGKEVWRIPSAKATPPAPVAAKPAPPVHPDIEEVQIYVKQYGARKADMIKKGRDLEARRSSISKQEYDRLRKEWWDDYESWDEELDDIFEEALPDVADDLTADEKKARNKEIEALKEMRRSWPADVMNPSR